MDTDKVPMNLTAGKFIRLIDCLKGTGVVNGYIFPQSFITSVCPLASVEDEEQMAFSNGCLSLKSQEERKSFCKNKGCPLLSDAPFEALVVKSSNGLYNSHLVNPVNGAFNKPKLLKIDKETFKTQLPNRGFKINSESMDYSNRQVLGVDENHSEALIRILDEEYNQKFKKSGILLPKIISGQFLKENTDFRLLGITGIEKPIPADPLTISLTGWNFFLENSDTKDLVDLSLSTKAAVESRAPLYDSLVGNILSQRDPLQRFIDIKHLFDIKR